MNQPDLRDFQDVTDHIRNPGGVYRRDVSDKTLKLHGLWQYRNQPGSVQKDGAEWAIGTDGYY